MTWPVVFLVLSLVGLALVVNAFHPVRTPRLGVISFFAAWPTSELPLWHVAWQAVGVAVLAALGALDRWPGWVAAAITVAQWAGLGVLAHRAARANTVLDAAAAEVPLPALDADVPLSLPLPTTGAQTMWRFPRLLYPFPRPAVSVRRIRNIDYWGDGRRRHRLDVIVGRTSGMAPSGSSGPSPSPGAPRQATPGSAERGAPVLVYIHGGAWMFGDKREQGLPMLHELARRGWVTVTINYGLSPRATWPEHIVDCKRAIAWVRDHIGELGGDPRFLAVSGGSAGGHLAALVALTAGERRWQPGFEDADTSVDACVPFYGVYDLTDGPDGPEKGLRRIMERYVFKQRFDAARDEYRLASPTHRVHGEAPPFFVIHGTNDSLVPVREARRFVRELRGCGAAPVLYAELPGTQHAFDVLPSVRGAHAVAAVVRFLETLRFGQQSRSQAPDRCGQTR